MMPTVIEVVQNAYGYNIIFNLQFNDGTPFDLTGCQSINLKCQFANTTGLKFSSVLEQSGTPTDGLATYTVALTDFNEAGIYNAQIQVAFSSGLQIFPNISFRAYKQLPNV